jgi:putative sterol carrier protein
MALEYGTDDWEREYLAELTRRMEKPPPYVYFTPEWAALYEKAVQADADYKEAARDWEGTVVLHILPGPDYGLDVDVYLLMDLWHGDCRSMRVVPPEAGEGADYVISGSLERWAQTRGDTTRGIMQGKLSLKGEVPRIVRAGRASQCLCRISSTIGGKYPLLLTTEEIARFRAETNLFAARFLANGNGTRSVQGFRAAV